MAPEGGSSPGQNRTDDCNKMARNVASRPMSVDVVSTRGLEKTDPKEAMCNITLGELLHAARALCRRTRAVWISPELKTSWWDGTSHLLLSPLRLLEKLAAPVPPSRFYLLRDHGVLVPRAREEPRFKRFVYIGPQKLDHSLSLEPSGVKG